MVDSSDIVFETSADVTCPHCGETVSIRLDPGGGTGQEYVEDCEVCCRPWRVRVRYRLDGSALVQIEPTD
ncbi:MAG: CPXCG motif-containing cysteine-rich protein [Gemmatimonadetes bacterium]|nr:CPXCG motif-containing cysteine-rich protein [Gemmatimonadota bacterium]